MNTQAKTKKRKTQKLGPKQEKWLRMLESGKFKQAESVLFDGRAYCCLGVACRSVGLKAAGNDFGEYHFQSEVSELPKRVMTELAFRTPTGDRRDHNSTFTLSAINDDIHGSFRQIAALVRCEPEQYFKKPA